MKGLISKGFTLDPKRIDLKALAKGELELVFATMGVWDKDGDWTEPGFFGAQQVQFIPAHDWDHVWMGKGSTREEGNEAIARVKVNIEIPSARDWLSAIKFDLENGEPLGQYSYGFRVLEGGASNGERAGKSGRILHAREDQTPGCKIWEISPVLVGAGERTRTLAAKGSMKFADEVAEALDAAEAVVARGASLAELRAKEGRALGQESRERLASLAAALEKTAKTLTGLLADPRAKDPELTKEIARMMRIRAGMTDNPRRTA